MPWAVCVHGPNPRKAISMNSATHASDVNISLHPQHRRLVRGVAMGAWLAAACVMPAMAQTTSAVAESVTPTAPIEEPGWTFEVTPYAWLAGIKGDIKTGRLPQTSVDMSFSDVFKVLDFAVMGSFEARKQRWGFLFDAQYLKASDSATSSTTGSLGVTRQASADITIKETVVAAAVTYRLSQGPTLVDAVGGLRYVNINADATIGASLFGAGGLGAAATVSRSAEKSWTDAYAGVRVQQPIAEGWSLVGYLDAGGGGSDFTWQAIAGANYQFSKSMTGKFGYRVLKIDYDKDQFTYDARTQGIYLGLGFAF